MEIRVLELFFVLSLAYNVCLTWLYKLNVKSCMLLAALYVCFNLCVAM